MKKKLNIGICGFGVVGKIRFKCLNKNSFVNVLAICDRKFKQNFVRNNINFYNSYEMLLKEKNRYCFYLCNE